MRRYSRVLAALLAGVAGSAAASPEACSAAADTLSVEGVTLNEIVHMPQGEGSPAAACVVRGVMDERTGMDGQTYALRFELRLPDDWQGRFMHQFNGGNDGAVVPALGGGNGTGDTPALARGMAVVSSDAGHDGEARPELGLAGSNAFGYDFEARRDYGYDAVATLHPVALELTEQYYGRAPEHVYGYGNSNGGRHGMVAVERMPEAFDGVLSGYPGFNLPLTGLDSAFKVQTFRSLAPTLAEAFSREDMGVLADDILAACDTLDGLEDGVVNDTLACQDAFDPAVSICTEGQNSDCLSEAQVEALVAVREGVRGDDGTPIYNSFYWDPGMASGNWRFWNLESPVAPWDNKPLISTLAAGSTAQVFQTPPQEVGGTPAELEEYLNTLDIAAAHDRLYATSEAFPESAMEMMTPPDADDPTLAAFAEAGGKLVSHHGAADPVFSLEDTVEWYERLQENTGNAEDFVRLYAVPGMPHGDGGNAADRFDALGALIGWVEEGEAPGPLEARFREDNPEAAANAGATRPLCPWPGVARYTGDDPMSADSFTCE